jgi:formylglycine-generating enzyme required for sulfatase activity
MKHQVFLTAACVTLLLAVCPMAVSSDPPRSMGSPTTQTNLTIELGKGITMEFVLIRPGTFMMGSNESTGEKRAHKATITKPFYLGKYEVTQEQWQAVMGDNHKSYFKGEKNPVERVSWEYCQSFVKTLGEKVPGYAFRLPTEAEWEYACRAGSTNEYCYGDNEEELGQYAWYGKNSGGKTHPVGEKKPNAWGLYDMHGNVTEWCQDQYLSNNWHRGGSFECMAMFCRSAKHGTARPATCSDANGLRMVVAAN